MSLYRYLLGITPGDETARARAEFVRTREGALAESEAEARLFRAEMERRAGSPHLDLGNVRNDVPLRLDLAALRGAHGWISGATGSGKTMLAVLLVEELFRAAAEGFPVAVVTLGMQGDFVRRARAALGRVLLRAPSRRRDDLLSRTLVANFFHGPYMVEWQVLARSGRAAPLVQASATAEIVEGALGAYLGHRQDTAITMVFAAAMHLGLTLAEVRLLLTTPDALRARAMRVADPLIQAYFEHRFLGESRTTLDGIASRLDRILGLDDALRGALAGPGTIDFEALFAPGSFAFFDLAATPLGAENVRRVLGGLIFHSLAQAAVSASRRVRGQTIIVLDEAQLLLTPGLTRTLETLLATVRQFGVGIWLVNQSLVQLPSELIHLLATNIRFRFLGRSGREDGRLSTEFLPKAGPNVRSRGHAGGRVREGASQSDAAEARLAALAALPERHFYVTERPAPWGVVEVAVRSFAPPSLDDLPAWLRDALDRGATGRPRGELIANARAREAEVLAALRASAPVEAPRRRGRTPASTPDVATPARAWRSSRRER